MLKGCIKSFFLLSFVVFLSPKAFASKSLTIFTEPNLAIAITQIARNFSQEYNVITSVNFNSPTDFVGEIDMGEPADVVITAHDESIETLQLKGLVDVYNIGYIAKDSINLVTSTDNSKIPSTLMDSEIEIGDALKILNDSKSTLILDNYYGSSSGRYCGDYLRSLGLDQFKVFTKLAEDRSPIVSSVIDNEEYYALLLSSQVVNKKELKIISKLKNSEIDYRLFVIAGNNMETARKFLKFFKSSKARKILLASGLEVPNS